MRVILSLFVSIYLFSCVSLKNMGLYDQVESNITNTNGLNLALPHVFQDQMSSEVWFTKANACLQVSSESNQIFAGSGAMKITWNKQAGDCPWLGLGIGWGNWTGKDLSAVENMAALSFRVKADQGEFSGLPWALGMEDFSGAQAWLGLTGKYVKGGKVTTDWNEFVIPLADFLFENWNMDGSSVKQLIFQFESSGTVYIDEIEIVPYTAPSKPTLTLLAQQAGKLDGIVFPNEYAGYVQVSMGTLHVNYDNEYVYFGLVNSDRTTPVNNQKGRDIWNGDAMEIAFSTESNLMANRPFLYDSDKHLGIQLAPPYSCFDWNSNKEIPAEVVSKISEKDQVVEVKIKWSDLKTNAWKVGGNYNFEFALDMALSSDKRDQQQRWSAVNDENFYNKPATWGVLNIVSQK
jgi:hypothetical protein